MAEQLIVKKPVTDIKDGQKLKRIKITKIIIRNALFYLVCLFFVFWMVLPFYWALISSIRPTAEINDINMTFFPKAFTFEHYKNVFDTVPLFNMLGNSILTTLTGLATNLFFGTLAAYSFAKLRFKGHKAVFQVMMISMMIPGVITLIPTFLVVMKFPLMGGNDITGNGGQGLYDSLAAVILPGAIGVYGIFFMRQFFVTLPDDMMESARIDGAGELRIFLTIYLPLVLPGLMTLGIFTFQGGWNNFMWPNIVLISDNLKLLTQSFIPFQSARYPVYGAMLAISTMMALPVILMFIFMQKFFIQGVTVGGVKG